MDKEFALQLLFIGLLVGGAIFFAHRLGSSTDSTSASTKLLPSTEEESRRYKNKENRHIELGYNEDGLLSSLDMEITRDYTIA